MKLEDALAYTEKCFNGEPASCSFACPFHLDIRGFLEKVEKGRWKAAYRAFRNAAVFPAVAAALCPASCGGHCQRAQIGDDVLDLSAIEDAVLRFTPDLRAEVYVIPEKAGRAAVVGAGSAGLSCALNLAQKKFSVTVFERESVWGGKLREHPRFAAFDADFVLQFAPESVDFRYNTTVNSLEELREYDAVYLATGAGGEDFGLLGGWDSELLTTADARVFLGGALAGHTLADGIARGRDAARMIEVFLQTGKTSGTYGGYDKRNCERYVRHADARRAARVLPSPGGYTQDEARREAARCLYCDCDACMASCEMLARFKTRPQKLATEVYTYTGVAPPYSSHTLTRETYSCSMCGCCKAVCPESIDLGALLQTSRAARVKSGDAPPALHDFWMREMDFSTAQASFVSDSSCEYLFFPGCQLGAMNPEHVFRSYAFLSEHFDAGIYLGCCGAPAYWAGDEARLNENFKNIRECWERLGKPVLVTACATCESVFADFLPELRTISLYELLAEAGDISPARVFAGAAVFDPCAARGDSAMRESVRTLATRAGIALEELPEQHRCCGYGGLIRAANPGLYETVTANRAELSDAPYIVYCANCRDVFASRGKSCAHVLDIAFGLTPAGKSPSIRERRQNSIRVKREMTGGGFMLEKQAWEDLELVMDGELAERIDRKLISSDDLREAIYRAEASGRKFVDGDGVRQCSLVKPVLTYWVRYKPADEGKFEIFDAYYHRMRFDGEVV
ncbi:MAG: NAD(P)-binding protein [Oscillospiraceae bacterium]|jgi:NADPH-dependent glutamate synthase beta subunit-like oxidoreductase|nr:NAD(P)-binding protein [Oscillospiraceae bacterium]